MKQNFIIFLLQMLFAVVGLIQLLGGAIIMALISVLLVVGIGAFENGG